MIILPGHHSGILKNLQNAHEDTVGIDTTEGQPSGGSQNTTENAPGEEENVEQITRDPLGPTFVVGSKTAGETKVPGVLQEEFDKYGAELGGDARFWKTYVKETDQWDAELVDGWNKSLDVILIFAALFSAVSTASKNLQQDNAQTSAQTLLAISQILLATFNNTQSQPLPFLTLPTSIDFAPSRSAVCVNALWYLSLSLSVSVSLIAMLAKEWCYSFMSGRTGDPCMQARRRQQRWDGIVRWKMPEVLVLLPSLIHLALLLFAVGLCIYLLDIHLGVAIPVIIVTVASVGLYATSTILPLLYNYCPYGTTISKVHQVLFQRTSQAVDEDPKQDTVTSQALHWIIVNCEVPRSVNVALQAIAGANENLPRELLNSCNAENLIRRRLTASTSYTGNYGTVMSLYARALSVLRSKTRALGSEDEISIHAGKLEVAVWQLQSRNERNVADGLSDGRFVPSNANLAALRIGSTVVSHCLRMFDDLQKEDMTIVESAITLLAQHFRREVTLHQAALLSLVNATGMLLSYGLAHHDPGRAVKLLMKLVHSHSKIDDWDFYSRLTGHVGLILAAFALSRHDYPARTRPPSLSVAYQAERALDMIAHYDQDLLALDPHTQVSLLHFGLSGLLRDGEAYGLGFDDYGVLVQAFNRTVLNPDGVIHRLPPSFNFTRNSVGAPALSIWPTPGREGSLDQEARASAYLHSLKSNAAFFSSDFAPIEQAFVLVIESACRAKSSDLKNICMSFMDRFPFPELSDRLVEAMIDQDIVRLLLRSRDTQDQKESLFATCTLWILVTLILHSDHGQHDIRQDLLAPLLDLKMYTDVNQHLELVEKKLLRENDEIWRSYIKEGRSRLHGSTYFDRVRECMLQAQGFSPSNPCLVEINDRLKYVLNELRGFKSLVGVR